MPGLVLLTFGLFAIRKNEQVKNIAALTLLGLPAMFIMLTMLNSWMYARFALFALPGAIFLIAIGIDSIWHMLVHRQSQGCRALGARGP